ncbi:hypothetical protein [Candidatus Clostridium radicumherbarum]|uniref:Uncharacterized protein n=1 Tax=Candidatus Clostridium radicumherbarum TaxID=3381662 RepID=A0ABW8TR99_9CLOT
MNYRVVNKNNNKYIEFFSDLRKLSSEQDVVMEANKGNHFRTFRNIGDAETWISNL